MLIPFLPFAAFLINILFGRGIIKDKAHWVAIIAVPTMIAGIYGMNFEHMPEIKFRYGYYIILAVMFAACGGLYRHFRKSGWL